MRLLTPLLYRLLWGRGVADSGPAGLRSQPPVPEQSTC